MKKFICILMILGPVSLQGARRGAFASLGYDAQALGMGGAFVSVAQTPGASYWNPAGLAWFQKRAITGMFGRLGPFPVFSGYLAVLEGNQGLGGGALTWEYRGIKMYDGEVSMAENAFSYSWGNFMAPNLAVGFRAKALWVSSTFETIDGHAKGFGLDLSALFQPFPNLRLGAMIWDLFSRLKWATGRTEAIPFIYQAGGSFSLLQDQLIVAVEARGEPEDYLTEVRLGTQACVLNLLALRLGYMAKLGNPGTDEADVLTAGVGFLIHRGPAQYNLDYAFLNMSGVLGAMHRISFNILW